MTLADIEEVRGVDTTEVATRVGDNVERRHHEARTVAHNADFAVELHVIEAETLGLFLEGVLAVD